ncbi:MAG: OadG family protein [Oscillospiraceae bacterium]|nr:OadG family protein [Oscillospiraceae bacterium]
MDYSNLFVCLMGICTVFIGLICIIVLVSAMSAVVRATDKAMAKPAPAVTAVPAADRDQVSPAMVAAVSAAIAEEMGTDISAIRIVSFKKV